MRVPVQRIFRQEFPKEVRRYPSSVLALRGVNARTSNGELWPLSLCLAVPRAACSSGTGRECYSSGRLRETNASPSQAQRPIAAPRTTGRKTHAALPQGRITSSTASQRQTYTRELRQTTLLGDAFHPVAWAYRSRTDTASSSSGLTSRASTPRARWDKASSICPSKKRAPSSDEIGPPQSPATRLLSRNCL